MIPTLLVGDHILVNKFVYTFWDPKRGDVIVFKYPKNEERDFIKRIVALPGEKIEIRDRQVFINDSPLSERYTFFEEKDNPGIKLHDSGYHYGPVTLPRGKIFVMGDNRENSMDSRFWGLLDEEKIRGRAFIIYWSWAKNSKSMIGLNVRWNRFGKILK